MAYLAGYSEALQQFVDIHGRDIRVVISEKSGDILIPLEELKETGFTIYRKSQYNKLLVDDEQFTAEFDLFMLESAKTYILKNRLNFREKEILESIDNCKRILTKNITGPPQNVFLKNRSVLPSPDKGFQIQIGNSPSPLTSQSLKQLETKSPSNNYRSPTPSINSEKSRNSTNQQEDRIQQRFAKTRDNTPNQNGDSQRSNGFSKPFNSNGIQLRQPKFDEDKASNETIPCCTLETDEEYDVVVTHIEKRNCAFVQNTANIETLAKIFELSTKEGPTQSKAFKPVMNKLYLAQFEEDWCRCKVIRTNPLTVLFVDYGNTAEIENLVNISKDLAAIPTQAIRVSFREDFFDPKIDESVRIKIKTTFDNTNTYYIHVVKQGNKSKHQTTPVSSATPKEPVQKAKPTAFFQTPIQKHNVAINARVGIIGEIEGRLMIRTKEIFDNLKKIDTLINNANTEPIENVADLQIVLCNKSNELKLHRAVVLEREGSSARVKYIDDGSIDTVPIKSMMHITEALTLEPISYFLTPQIKGFTSKKLSTKNLAFIKELIQNRVKSTVIHLTTSEVDLQLDDSILLSKKLKDLDGPSDRVMLQDMKTYTPKLGTHTFMCYSFKDLNSVTLMSVDMIDHLGMVVQGTMSDPKPHTPMQDEVCWGSFQDDWYRCVVKSVKDGQAQVLFFDFGNEEVLDSSKLRKITDDVINIPVLSFQCKFIGIPHTPEVESQLKTAIEDGDPIEVEIKSFNDDKFEITIPSIYQKLNL